MTYMPKLSLSVWALLVLLAGGSVLCLSPAWSADQKPLVVNPTTGKNEQLQPGNRLQVPDASGDMVVIEPGVQTSSRTLSIPVLAGSDTIGTLAVANAWTGINTFSARMGVGGSSNSQAIINVGASNPLTGAVQTGVLASHTGTSAATTRIAGFQTGVATAAASFTCPDVISHFCGTITQGAGSTITRGTGMWASDPNAGSNKACLVLGGFSLSYTGNWSIYSQSTDDSYFAGDIQIGVAGKGLEIKEGTNAKMGATALVGGTITVNTTAVTANSRIYLTSQVDGGTPGYLRVSARTAATSFTITSGSGTDTSTVAWMIVEPAP